MRALQILLLVLALTLTSTSALAQDDDGEGSPDYSRTGAYLGLSGVYVFENWTGTNRNAGADNTQGLNVRAGARISRWASVELELEWVDDFLSGDRQDLQVLTATVNTKVYPLGGRIQPFILAGLGIASTVVNHRDPTSSIRQSNADWGFRAGGGVDFYYTEQLAVSIEATHLLTVGDVADIDHVSVGIGILYRF